MLIWNSPFRTIYSKIQKAAASHASHQHDLGVAMKKFLLVCAAFVLTACGGGGGDSAPSVPTSSTPPPAATTAAGFWEGTASTGVSVALAILEDGQTWGVYTSGNAIAGALYGSTSSSGTSLSGSGRDFNIPSRSVEAATYTGTFIANNRISVTTSSGGSLSATYASIYDQPASLAALAGTYSGTGITGSTSAQSTPITISSTGAITVPVSGGCGATGTATPRASGKNIFDVSVTFNGTACALGNGSITTGVGYFNSTTRRLLVLALNAPKTDGFIYSGQK